MDNNSKQEIINSLLQYLPEISSSLNKIVTSLNEVIKAGSSRDKDFVSPILAELQQVLPMLEKVIDIDPPKSSDGTPIYSHTKSLSTILAGLKAMLRWLTNEQESTKTLVEAANLLFTGSQQLMALVEQITE